MTFTAEERMKKAIIKLQSRQPFFAYLSLYLKFHKAEKGQLPPYAGMGVSPSGDLYYNEEWVNNLDDEEMIGVISHEVLHLALVHLLRLGSREKTKWNVAADLTTNTILLKNNFKLPYGTLKADDYDKFKIKGKDKTVIIEKVSEKTSEELYDEIPDLPEQECEWGEARDGDSKEGDKKGKGGGGGDNYHGFDEHQQGTGTKSEKEKQEKDWLRRVSEAYTNSKMKGSLPVGMERYIEELKKNQINWRALLQKYLQSCLPTDYTWKTRSKKSVACHTYMPNILKEKIDVVISIDTSGSIGKKELTDFLSEIVGLAKAYSQQIDMRLICQDVDVAEDLEVKNGNIGKIMQIKCKGGGGTSHIPVFKYIQDKYKNTRVVIFLTDGYSDIQSIDFEDFKFEKIFVISKGGTSDCLNNKKCIKIHLKE